MKRMKTVAAALLVLTSAAGGAYAAGPTHEADGRIERLNPRGHNVTIGHQIYRYDPRTMGLDLKRGTHVHVVYRNAHGRRYAIQILPAA